MDSMTVAQTSPTPDHDHPGFKGWVVQDMIFGFLSCDQELSEHVYRCDGNYGWDDDDEDRLDYLCEQLGDWLDNNPAQTWDSDRRLNWKDPRLNSQPRWKELRETWGYSLTRAAKEIGVNPASISRWETGSRHPESIPYRNWLTEQWGKLVAHFRYLIYYECLIRDMWPNDPVGPEQEAQWNEFWRVGGYFDQWRKTGKLANTNRWGSVSEWMSQERTGKKSA